MDEPVGRLNLGSTAAAGLLALVLLLSLAPLPHAAAQSNHTWRVELAAGIFLFGAVASRHVHFALRSTLSKRIAILFAIFAFWGLISAAWARSVSAVAHHTILWCEYGFLFILVSEVLRTRGRSFLITTFAAFATLIGLVTLSDYVTLPDFGALEGTLRQRYSAYGELSIAMLPLLWIPAIYRRRIGAWLIALLPAILGWSAAMLSLSKGVFIAGVAGFTLAFGSSVIFGKKVHRKRIIATAAVWLLLTITVQVGFSVLTPIPATVDYISGKADQTRETSTARIFIWRTTVPLIREHWLLGVGADNFGLAANEGRAEYRRVHPADPPDEINADYRLERPHNEPLEVLAELGVPGLILFSLPFGLFLWTAIKIILIKRRRPSLMFWAATAGMAAFAMSSMVSSFSLRIVPNGIAFFLVFAIAVHELSKAYGRNRRSQRMVTLPKPAVACVLLFAISILSLRGYAEYCFTTADGGTDSTTAVAQFSRAAALDPEYAAAHYRLSFVEFKNGNYSDAAVELRKAIDNGFGVVLTYSSLAECYRKAGDQQSEFSTFEEGLRIYPRSIFLRVRYAIELEKAGLNDSAQAQLATARDINVAHANGWYSLITRGSVRTFYDARARDDIATPSDLKPDAAVLQYIDKDPGQ